ncbi:MAG: hypothetical protein Q8L78_04035 [Coxiellaceae bacterium]|nr:hypothetical protein [Coxiellaceae bacterium]
MPDYNEQFKQRHPAFDLSAIGGYEEVMDQLTDIVSYLQDLTSLTNVH